MPNTTYHVDFKNKTVLDVSHIPKQTKWKCSACGKDHINVEGSETNTLSIKFDQTIYLNGNVNKPHTATVVICKPCVDSMKELLEGES